MLKYVVLNAHLKNQMCLILIILNSFCIKKKVQFISDMEDGKSLLDIKTSPLNYFKRLSINKNSILPFLGFLLLLSCLIFIFSILLESGRLIEDGYIFLCIVYYRWALPNTVEELQQVLLQTGG